MRGALGKMQNACTLEIALSDEFLNFAFRIFQSKCKLVTVFWNLGYKCYRHCWCICVVWYSLTEAPVTQIIINQ